MARFVRHAACQKCGSRNNRGVYDDGSEWCFGCHDYTKANASSFVPKAGYDDESTDGRSTKILDEVLERSVAVLPEHVVDYGRSYGVGLQGTGAAYYPPTDSLIFFYYTAAGTLCCAQARSFRAGLPKYFNWGSTYPVIDVNGTNHPPGGLGGTIVITEDKLSAMKVSGVFDACPALGTQFQNHKLLELFKRGYRRVYVWLDRDKWKEGREICEKAQWLGMSATAVLTDEDPKCYSHEEIFHRISGT